MRIAFLHTADVHVATFNQIFTQMGVTATLDHRVDAGLLEKARTAGINAVRGDVLRILDELSDADAVLCTCSTLGPIADDAAETAPNIIRIDRPLMENACAAGSKVLVSLCLDSTRDATLDLLNNCAAQAGKHITPVVVICQDAWAYFERGDTEAYALSIAKSIKSTLAHEPDVDGIILAQASMRVAEPALKDVAIPIYSSPALAAERCVQVARRI